MKERQRERERESDRERDSERGKKREKEREKMLWKLRYSVRDPPSCIKEDRTHSGYLMYDLLMYHLAKIMDL